MLPLLQCLAHSPPLTSSRVARILAGEAGAACDELPEPVDAGEDWDERVEQARLAAEGGSYDEGDRLGGPDRCVLFRVYPGSSVKDVCISLPACHTPLRSAPAGLQCVQGVPACILFWGLAFNREVPSRHLCLG